MFGPGIDHAIEEYSCPDRQLLAVLQLFRAQRQILFRYEIQPGKKIAEVPVKMPSGKIKV
jgi:nitrate reductase beta subunit